MVVLLICILFCRDDSKDFVFVLAVETAPQGINRWMILCVYTWPLETELRPPNLSDSNIFKSLITVLDSNKGPKERQSLLYSITRAVALLHGITNSVTSHLKGKKRIIHSLHILRKRNWELNFKVPLFNFGKSNHGVEGRHNNWCSEGVKRQCTWSGAFAMADTHKHLMGDFPNG